MTINTEDKYLASLARRKSRNKRYYESIKYQKEQERKNNTKDEFIIARNEFKDNLAFMKRLNERLGHT